MSFINKYKEIRFKVYFTLKTISEISKSGIKKGISITDSEGS